MKPFITMNYNESVVSKFRANGLLQLLRHHGVGCRSRPRKKNPSYLRRPSRREHRCARSLEAQRLLPSCKSWIIYFPGAGPIDLKLM